MFLKRDFGNLYYEVYGTGEPLLLIHGLIVDADLYKRTAHILSQYYQVICFDRRGCSRSKCEKTIEFSLQNQAEDIFELLKILSIEKVNIVGASAGAVIGQFFLEKYPDKVNQLIMYEPAMLGHMLREDNEFKKWAKEMESLIQKKKYNTALLRFSEHIGTPDSRSPQKSEETVFREFENIGYAFTKEVPGLLDYNPDLKKMQQEVKKIVIAVGEKSGNTVYVQEASRLAKELEIQVLFYPGGHNLPYDLPIEFAISILGTLKMKAVKRYEV